LTKTDLKQITKKNGWEFNFAFVGVPKSSTPSLGVVCSKEAKQKHQRHEMGISDFDNWYGGRTK
jgi:hypothetical protein